MDDPPGSAAFTGVARASRRGPAVVLLAGVGVLAFAVWSGLTTAPDAVPSPLVTPAASVAAVASPTTAASDRPATPAPLVSPPPIDGSATPWPAAPIVATAAGPTVLVPAGQRPFLAGPPVQVTVVLPDGWSTAGAGVVVKGDGAAPAGLSVGAWIVDTVPIFPCRWATSDDAPAAQMATAAGQAQALSEWWGQVPGGWPNSNARIAPLATRPHPATVAGLDAVAVEVLVVRDFDFDQCDAGQLVLWETADGQARTGAGQGEVHRLWVVDVGGTIVTMDAASFHATSAADQAELQSILDSLVIGA